MSRVTIGRADLISLEEARKKARQMLGSMTAGVDPNAIKHNQRAASLTLSELLEAYLIAKASLLRPTTISVYRLSRARDNRYNHESRIISSKV